MNPQPIASAAMRGNLTSTAALYGPADTLALAGLAAGGPAVAQAEQLPVGGAAVPLGADLAGLLALPVRPRVSRDRRAVVPPSQQPSRIPPGLLAPQAALVRHWLSRPVMVSQLQGIGLSPADVEHCLRANIASWERGKPARIMVNGHAGLAIHPHQPRAHDLFVYAVQDAERRLALREFALARPVPASTPGSGAMAPANPDAAAAAAAAAEVAVPPLRDTRVDMARRETALAALRGFSARIPGALREFGAPTTDGFWGMSEGKITLDSLEDALASVPCVSSLHGAAGGPHTATYPQNFGEGTRLRQVRVRMQGPLTVAHGENPHRMRYSLDRGLTWTETEHYTDDVVEYEKTRLWASVIEVNRQARRRHVLAARWLPW